VNLTSKRSQTDRQKKYEVDFEMKSERQTEDFIDVGQINFLGGDVFEAGLEAAEGNLVGIANR
jgi:hypothetical protein